MTRTLMMSMPGAYRVQSACRASLRISSICGPGRCCQTGHQGLHDATMQTGLCARGVFSPQA